MRQDWVRVARPKGLGKFQLWRRHVLPALGLPMLGSSFGMLRVMVGGLVIVDYLTGFGFKAYPPGTANAPLGTDNYLRDLFSRLLYAAVLHCY